MSALFTATSERRLSLNVLIETPGEECGAIVNNQSKLRDFSADFEQKVQYFYLLKVIVILTAHELIHGGRG